MVTVILQARTSSSRLPGKVLKPILGKPMLWHQIERIKRAKRVDNIVLATSTDPSDDAIADFAKALGVTCFRGSLPNVLERYYGAATPYSDGFIVRLTGDCPFSDPALLDQLIHFHIFGGYDYSSNCQTRTFPKGLDMEICHYSVLKEAYENATTDYEKEHVTPYIYQTATHFKLGVFKQHEDYSHLRWTVDTPADFELTCRLYGELYPNKPDFLWRDVLSVVQDKPELQTLNL
ncbi:MAG: glycosyltransferase family protein [bacterium]|nr:glycosyltransferase family protein [bacterium]